MKKYICLFVIAMVGLALKGYSNYHSYPKYHTRTITLETEDKDDEDIFFSWQPVDGRDRPVWKCNRNKYTHKYRDMEITDYLQWGM